MLARAAVSAARRSVLGSRQAYLARAFAADTSPTLQAPESKKYSPEDFPRFDPSNWVGDNVDPAVKTELARIRVAEDEAIAAVTKEVPDIDWDAWREQISYPGIVDELKAAHDAIEVPDFLDERERMQKAIHDAFGPMLAELKSKAEEATAASEKYEKRLAEITHLHDAMEDIPIDEFLEKYPSVRKSIEDDLENNKWFV